MLMRKIFLNDLKTNLRLEPRRATINICFLRLTKSFKKTIDKHAPQKKRKIRGNQAAFMSKELNKQSMKRSKSKNLYFT